MFNLVLYGLLAVAVTLPLCFRKSFGVRLASVAFLIIIAGLPAVHLLASHRLVIEKGDEVLKVPRGENLPEDFMVAVDYIQLLNARVLYLYLVIVAAFVILALVPFRGRTDRLIDRE